MIPPKEAVSNAKKYLRGILEPEEEISDLRLEEVEFEEFNKQWLITLGYLRLRDKEVKYTIDPDVGFVSKNTLRSLFEKKMMRMLKIGYTNVW